LGIDHQDIIAQPPTDVHARDSISNDEARMSKE